MAALMAALPRAARWLHRPRPRQRSAEAPGARLDAPALDEGALLQELLACAECAGCAGVDGIAAKRLLSAAGSLHGLLSLHGSRLRHLGLAERQVRLLLLVREAVVRSLRPRPEERLPLDSGDAVIDYLQADMAARDREVFRVLFLNNRNRLLADEIMWEGTVNQAPCYPREIIMRALELGATALVLAHNHPSGDPAPSREDVSLTRTIVDAGKPLGIHVHDHFVVASGGTVSLRAEGLL